MEKFSETENALVSIDDLLEKNPEYKRMLNNLLGISSRDNATFSSGKTNNIDLSYLLSDSDLKKAFNKESFSLVITNEKGDLLINELSGVNTALEFIETVEENGEFISIADRKLLERNFEEAKNKIIIKLKKQKNKKITKWKRFRNKYLDQQSRTNTWPLYVGTMFVKVKTLKATLYAPLLLKKVEISISNSNRVTLKSIDDGVEINEKLLFLLASEYQFNLPKLNEDAKFSFDDVTDKFVSSLSDIVSETIDFVLPFEYLRKSDVRNEDIQFSPGLVLTITTPSGGGLRDKLIDLLYNNELEDVLEVDVLADTKRDVMEDLQNKEAVFRITQADFSQEKAIIGSLKNHSVIWGPPGTGKSQTIANILANLLYRNNRVLVTSEKKAALDVIQKRMNTLSKYMFFGLTDKNINKEEFYKPFRVLMEKLRTTNYSSENIEPSTLLATPEWKLFMQKENLKDENIDALVYIAKKIENDFKWLSSKIEHYWKASKKYKSIITKFNNQMPFEEFLIQNKVLKTGIFKSFPKDANLLIKFLKKTNNDIELLKSLSNLKSTWNIFKINEYILNEVAIQKLDRKQFDSDEEYLDRYLAFKFRAKIEAMNKDPKTRKLVRTFVKNCDSAYRIPHKFVSVHKEIILKIYKIFVSTPQTLASSIDMTKKYDYAIFDEASQLHLEKAIPFAAMANISIIAGDNQQMRPTSYFGVRDSSEKDEDSEMSVDSFLDFAYRKGLKPVEYMLTKNYRSKSAELMLFSSKHFYDGNLDVIDSCESLNYNSIEVIDVDGKWESTVNEKEALEALDIVVRERSNFKKIILLTLNSSQKQFIESLIYKNEKYAKVINMLEDEKLYLRNLENIQGDEAGLVVVSVAYDKNAHLGSTYVAKPEGKNALNVAISRAVKKMIVLKSIKASEVKGNAKNVSMKIFREWLSYLEQNSIDRQKYCIDSSKQAENFESGFEENVYDYLTSNLQLSNKTYIQAQYPVGSYRIDLAIIDSATDKFLLGIEVDGYKYHSGFEKMIKDVERQRFIEAKGYPIYRITELSWKTDPSKETENIARLI